MYRTKDRQRMVHVGLRYLLAYAILMTALVGGQPVYEQKAEAQTQSGRAGDLNPRNFRMPPFQVWTQLQQRDLDSILPRGSTARLEATDRGQNRYLVSGITDLVSFGIDLGHKATERNAGVPGIGKQGAANAVPIDQRIKGLVSRLAEMVHNLVYARYLDPDPRKPFPRGPYPNPQQIILERPSGFDRERDPGSSSGGRWVRYCEPTTACVRPVEPIPEDVPDCAAEQAEVDRLLGRIDQYNQDIKGAEDLLLTMEAYEAGGDVLDVAVSIMVVYAIFTCPIGAAAGLAAVAGGFTTFKAIKALAADIGLGLSIQYVKDQISELKRIRALYYDELNTAFRDLRNCRTAAAAAEGRNTAAFQKYIGVDLPAYYECLKNRRCGRRWVPN